MSAIRPGVLARRYFAFAHLALASAACLLILEPRTYVGFFYHPRMMAVVHLITLGWLSGSILGALYWVMPFALRARLAAGRADAVAFWSFTIGVLGMVSHFWLDSYGGMVWSALLAAGALGFVALRAARAVAGAKIALGVKLHVAFAALNIVLTAGLGIIVGLARVRPILPASTLDNVFAHLHLGAIGWVTMMLFGVGYRLLPMIVASRRMPSGWAPVTSAILLEVGVLAVASRYIFSLPAWVRAAGAFAIMAGIAIFVLEIRSMLADRLSPGADDASRPRHRPRTRPRPGLDRWPMASWHGRQALAFLFLAAALGSMLASGRLDPELALRLAPVYGVVGLLGFLGRAVAGVATYLLPVAAWVEATRTRGASSERPPPDHLGDPRRQLSAFIGWTLAVPILAVGLFLESPLALRLAGALLLIAVSVGAIDHRRSFRIADG